MNIALAQIALSSNVASNLATILEYIRRAAGERADLVVFPEYALSGTPREELLVAERAKDLCTALDAVVDECRSSGVGCLLPTLWYASGWHSSAFVIEPRGIALRHDKAVLSYAEQGMLAAGERVSVVDVGNVRCGLLLCAEGNGSELFALQSLAGAEVILHASAPDAPPGASDLEEGETLWTMPMTALFPVRGRIRAFGEQVWIVSVVPAGCGSLSKTIAPNGDVPAVAPSEQPTLILVEVDTAAFPFRSSAVFARRREVFVRACRDLLAPIS